VDYFLSLGYQEKLSSSLLSEKLPMTFVMSAGMVQFEDLTPAKCSGNHYVLIQNCFRHFDMDLVGNSDFHLSLFQMPGAFDFNPIDREGTIHYVWDLLTEWFGFDPERLYVTYSTGAEVEGHCFPEDKETAAAWKSVSLPRGHLLGLPGKNNFWRMSDRMIGITNSRKCGPTTEVFYDRGVELACGSGCQPGCQCGRFVEFMNNLFITKMITDDNRVDSLPEPFVEIVIGRERVAALLQGAGSVYEIDNLLPLIEEVRCFTHAELLPPADRTHHERLLVDHLRALLFLFNDGAPGPEKKGGREHIIRVLIRELLTSEWMLGIVDPGFQRSMLLLVRALYPRLSPSAYEKFTKHVTEEGLRFRRTVSVGLSRFERELRAGKLVDGEDLLYYEKEQGVPHSLIAHLLWQKHLAFDQTKYQAALNRFQQDSRNQSNATE
jgi:alanyl-tRNA synthetase